jgi:hypothetical protein
VRLCRCKGKAWYAIDNPKRAKNIVYAGDVYFCCHEFKEISELDMASLMWTQKAYLAGL